MKKRNLYIVGAGDFGREMESYLDRVPESERACELQVTLTTTRRLLTVILVIIKFSVRLMTSNFELVISQLSVPRLGSGLAVPFEREQLTHIGGSTRQSEQSALLVIQFAAHIGRGHAAALHPA